MSQPMPPAPRLPSGEGPKALPHNGRWGRLGCFARLVGSPPVPAGEE
jgi:hypothetical protein